MRSYWLLLALLGVAGCTGLPMQLPTGVEPIPGGPPLRHAGKELTAAQSAEVAWAVAEELKAQGFETEALEQFEKVRQVSPNRADLAWRLAVLYERKGQLERAGEEYERALRVDPRNPELLNDLGCYYLNQDDYDRAEEHLRKAIEQDPHQSRALGNLGIVLARKGQASESLAQFRRVLPPAQANCNVGLLLIQAGHSEVARAYLEEAVRLDSSIRQATAALDRLDGKGRPKPLPVDITTPVEHKGTTLPPLDTGTTK